MFVFPVVDGVRGEQLTFDDDGGEGTCSLLTDLALVAGTYVIEVEEYNRNLAIPAYTLRIAFGAACGDGELGGDEECDDGNLDNGDGCDAACLFEPAGLCAGGVEPTPIDFGFSVAETGNKPALADASCVAGETGQEVVFVFQPVAGGEVCVDLSDSNFTTVVHVRTHCSDAGTEIGCDVDSGPGGASLLTLAVDADTPYFIFVDGVNPDNSGTALVNLTDGACP